MADEPFALADRVAAISQTQDDPETFEASFEYRLRILRPSVYTVCWRRPAEGTSFAPGAGEDESFRTEVGRLQLEGPLGCT